MIAREQLISRWDNEWKPIQEKVTHALLNKKSISKLELARTEAGLIDLRGYSAPKTLSNHVSRKGNKSQYVSEGVRIKNQSFEKTDLSHSDFEMCHFFKCHFRDCVLDKARLREIKFWGCTIENTSLHQTDFGYSSFVTNNILFPERIINLRNLVFDHCNLSEVHLSGQGLQDCHFMDCKTGMFMLNDSRLERVRFTGKVKNLYFDASKIKEVDLREAVLSGIQFKKQKLDGFLFPSGDTYYMFTNKTEELTGLQAEKGEEELLGTLKDIWLRDNLEVDFVDINWLNEDEIEMGKSFLKALKRNNS